jgi:hypothetical protein
MLSNGLSMDRIVTEVTNGFVNRCIEYIVTKITETVCVYEK